MTGDENGQHNSAAPVLQDVQENLQSEPAAIQEIDKQAQDLADARNPDGTAQDSMEDVKMQDASIQENAGAMEVDSETKTGGDQATILVPLVTASEDQQISEEQSPPQSPRVTDALEAALDGLLGPVVEDTTSEQPVPTNGGQPEEQAPKDTIQADAAPIPEVAPAEGGDDANPEWEVDSSPYESSSSDSSDDSSDDDESDVEESKLGVEETARLLMAADGGSDDEMDGAKAAKHAAGIRTKNEQPDEPEPIPEIKIEADDSIEPLGLVQHLVEGTQVVIEALRGGTAVNILDRGTVLCKEDRSVLGVIHDTIATVHRPMYILKFKSDEQAKEAALERGTQIWYSKSHAKFVFPQQLRQEKGSDASNLHDEEVGPDEVEYSDDEQEQAHKREKKNRKRGKGKGPRGDDHDSRARPANGDSNLRYDDDNDDGPYKPLSRPANFGMGLPPPPPPGVSAFPPAQGGRGGQHHQNRRGGGDFRGRGGRGRGFNGRGRGGHGPSNHQLPAPPSNAHQPPPPFAANPPPLPGQWPFPIPPPPQFLGGAAPPNPGAPNPGFPMPNWGAGQQHPFPFPPGPPLPNWPNAVPRPPQQTGYPAPAAGYGIPPQYSPNGTASSPAPAPPNGYQYPHYYGGGGQGQGQGQDHQAQNGQSQQRWG